MSKILVVNGSNVNIEFDNDQVNQDLVNYAKQYNLEVDFFQSNLEGEIIDTLQEAGESGEYKAVILNPGAYIVSSLGIKDICQYNEAAKQLPTVCVTVENNLKNPDKQTNVVGKGCFSTIAGFGPFSYHLAVIAIANIQPAPQQ